MRVPNQKDEEGNNAYPFYFSPNFFIGWKKIYLIVSHKHDTESIIPFTYLPPFSMARVLHSSHFWVVLLNSIPYISDQICALFSARNQRYSVEENKSNLWIDIIWHELIFDFRCIRNMSLRITDWILEGSRKRIIWHLLVFEHCKFESKDTDHCWTRFLST